MWYYSKNYYFRHTGEKEVNLKVIDQDIIHLWVYDHSKNELIEDNKYHDIDDVRNKVFQLCGIKNIPTFQELLKIKDNI